jgi:Rps23 Pro-64 3,4-dihydroxylase Tpa1-like proline 4-hydroxylase
MINPELPKKMKTQYSSGYPFPHIIIDDFIPEILIDKSLKELNQFEYWGHDPNNLGVQVNKFFSPWCDNNIKDIDNYAPVTKFILEYLNSKEVLNFLEELTGIPNLIADDTWVGGGVHKINSGGKLSIHSDYSVHPKNGLYRRINLLIYLNRDWEKSWGGSLQLWEKDMSKCVQDILPIFNRAVIFNTTQDAFHGHPHPLNTPEEISRYSFALYYFTKEKPEMDNFIETHHAVWKDLPSEDSDVFKF